MRIRSQFIATSLLLAAVTCPTAMSAAVQAQSTECSSTAQVKIDKPITPITGASSSPASFTYLIEVIRGKTGKPIKDLIWEVDTHSVLHIDLFKKVLPPGTDTTKIKVQVSLLKGDASTEFKPADLTWSPCDDDLLIGPRLDMNDSKMMDKDAVRIVVTNENVADKPSVTYNLARKDLGWHRSISDTVAFIQRLGVTKGDVANGVAKVNFGAAPGVTLATSYAPRHDEQLAWLRFLSPSVGITASFMDWKDQTVTVDTTDPTMPKFTGSPKGSDITLGLGGQLAFLDGSISVLYGWNLQATGPRRYWGIGLSFVNVYQKIQGYTSATTTAKTDSTVK